jgi:hypothetical protein
MPLNEFLETKGMSEKGQTLELWLSQETASHHANKVGAHIFFFVYCNWQISWNIRKWVKENNILNKLLFPDDWVPNYFYVNIFIFQEYLIIWLVEIT